MLFVRPVELKLITQNYIHVIIYALEFRVQKFSDDYFDQIYCKIHLLILQRNSLWHHVHVTGENISQSDNKQM